MGFLLLHRLPLSLFFIFIFSPFIIIPSSSSLSPDGESLLALSKNLVLPSSLKPPWNSSDSTPCNWVGVQCDRRHSVVSLDLSGHGVSGFLGPELGLLKDLKTLDLHENKLSGDIPPELGNCTLLSSLDLSNNSLSGDIPASLGNLRRLSYLSLFNNSLAGGIPESLFGIPTLETLFLNQNNLNGSIPSGVGNATKMEKLWLSQNQLSGTVPDSIASLVELKELYLLGNQLRGALPANLSNLQGLEYMDVSANGLTGKIPPFGLSSCKKLKQRQRQFDGELPASIANCSGLTLLAAVNNSLTGPIPPSISLLVHLKTLYLSQNSLSGPIPREIGQCRSLEDLWMSENKIQGPVPRQFGELSNLSTLVLSKNNLSGEFPQEIWRIEALQNVVVYDNNLIGELPPAMAELRSLSNILLFANQFSGVIPQGLGINSSQLVMIDFTGNGFTGPIPPSICSGGNLQVLALGSNLLQGNIPKDLGNCPSLERLNLGNNNLEGPLPDFVENPSLSYMNLRGNNLNGNIPPTIGNCVLASTIDLSGNNLVGPIPQAIGNLTNLQVLNMSYNHLHGQLRDSISLCGKLYILDLAFNSLGGPVPPGIANLTLLSQMRFQNNGFVGGIPNFLSQLGQILELQLGGNMFGGRIPPSLGFIRSLQISLNLSGNSLTGPIPPELRSLDALQVLDLSINNLTGSLAPLGGMLSLLDVDISYNHFSGPVPENLISLLNSSPPGSFAGNPDLCVPCRAEGSGCPNNAGLAPCKASSRPRRDLGKAAVVLISLGSFLLAIIASLLLFYLLLRWKRAGANEEEDMSLEEGSSFLLNRVMEATENLNDKYILGRGAQGVVYKACLGPQTVYAVKKLVFSGNNRGASNAGMLREIQTVGKIKHRNLVKLVNFWLRSDYGLLLYEYMENGSLHEVLHGAELGEPDADVVLDWKARYGIALGTAQGLVYLHEDCSPAIVHRDIKPKNILLDSNMEPHISDFGIAKLIDSISASPQSSALLGTIGYLSPETAFSTRRNKESDVYSYGVVLLELITRKQVLDPSFTENTDIVGFVSSSFANMDGIINTVVDPGLWQGISGQEETEVRQVLRLALLCTAKDPGERPSMRSVVKQLTDLRSTGIGGSGSQKGGQAIEN